MIRFAEQIGLPVNVMLVLGGVLLALSVGSLIRLGWLGYSVNSAKEVRARLGSLATWWVLLILLIAIVTLGRIAGTALLGLFSLLGMREYRNLQRVCDHGAVPGAWILAVVPLHYLLICLAWLPAIWTFIPVWILMTLLICSALKGKTRNFVGNVGVAYVGLMLIVFLFSHTALILDYSERLNPVAGAVGLLVYLVLLTELNDIAQALAGRYLGRRKIVPEVSPGKTWEGFLAGGTTTVLAAVVLAPWITPFSRALPHLEQLVPGLSYLPAVAVGLIISVGGFLGDITFSAIKREAAVKDSGTALPGQGGILDRIDSLTFTAPLFFYYTLAVTG